MASIGIATEPQLITQAQITIPPGVAPGQTLRTTVNGVTVDIMVPGGVVPGQTITVEVPMPAAATMPTPAAAVAVPIHHPQEDEVYVPLPMKQFDITPGCGAICCINEKLILGDQQLVWKKRVPCGVQSKRRPWAELGEVIKIETPCGSTILAPDMMGFEAGGENKGQAGWHPGCCANQSYVNHIVAALEERKTQRGHAAQSVSVVAPSLTLF